MEELEVKPNDITFIGVLHACSHAGLVAEGKRLFDKMVNCLHLVPKIEHYGCMVDILGRTGLLGEAHEMIKNMPIRPNTIVWGALLASCKLNKNSKLGEHAARKLLKLEPQNCGYNGLMSNIYAAANRWTDVAGVRKAMKDSGIKKEPGISSIEVNGSVHEFIMGDKRHPQIAGITDMLVEMSKKLKEESYWDSMKSGVANMVNAGDHQGGAITAALFLKQFSHFSCIGDSPFLHAILRFYWAVLKRAAFTLLIVVEVNNFRFLSVIAMEEVT